MALARAISFIFNKFWVSFRVPFGFGFGFVLIGFSFSF